jgi:hypothetical protein
MRTRSISLALVLACGGAAAAQLSIAPEQAVIEFDTKIGIVTFLHQQHADLSVTECTTCHHTLKPGEAVQPCHACHNGKAGDELGAKTAFHTRCIECHEYTMGKGEPAGPVKKMCRLCHVK